MIHDIINIILLIYVINEVSKYINNNSENMKDTDNKSLTKIINDKINEIFKKLFLRNRDENVVYNPLVAPEQRIESRQYPYNNTLFWEKTRGEPDDYQLVGLLFNTDVNKNYQLYGRRIYPGAYEWEYYIRGRDAGGLDIKLPIQLNNKEEIRDGITITVPIDKNAYTVSIYNYDQPRYNPFPNFNY
jgi:hypothetical protein